MKYFEKIASVKLNEEQLVKILNIMAPSKTYRAITKTVAESPDALKNLKKKHRAYLRGLDNKEVSLKNRLDNYKF
jgi:hypothetical protein